MHFNLSKIFAVALAAGTTIIDCKALPEEHSLEKKHIGGMSSLVRRMLDVPEAWTLADIVARAPTPEPHHQGMTNNAEADKTNNAQGGKTNNGQGGKTNNAQGGKTNNAEAGKTSTGGAKGTGSGKNGGGRGGGAKGDATTGTGKSVNNNANSTTTGTSGSNNANAGAAGSGTAKNCRRHHQGMTSNAEQNCK